MKLSLLHSYYWLFLQHLLECLESMCVWRRVCAHAVAWQEEAAVQSCRINLSCLHSCAPLFPMLYQTHTKTNTQTHVDSPATLRPVCLPNESWLHVYTRDRTTIWRTHTYRVALSHAPVATHTNTHNQEACAYLFSCGYGANGNQWEVIVMLMSSWELVRAVCGVHVGILLDYFLLVCVSVVAVLTLCIIKGTIAQLVPVFKQVADGYILSQVEVRTSGTVGCWVVRNKVNIKMCEMKGCFTAEHFAA